MSLKKILLKEFSNTSFIREVQKNPNFQKWFGDSKVVDENNDPKVVFHATYGDFTEFKKGDIGYHFGTDRSARERIKKRLRMSSEFGFKKTGAYFLSIQNPLFTHDFESWDVIEELINGLAIALGENNITDEKEYYEEWMGIFNGETDPFKFGNGDFKKEQLIEKIKEQLINEFNIDGIIYENDFEDAGSESYIAFKPTQIKSIFNNGEFNPNNNNFMK